MSRRFYVLLFCIMSVSAILLGFSYAKESGETDVASLAEIHNETFRVVFSNNKRLDTMDNNQVDISIINKDTKDNHFALQLDEIDGQQVEDVYYSIDDAEEQKLTNGLIDLGSVKAYGSDGDYTLHHLKIRSVHAYEFSLSMQTLDTTLLRYVIENSEQVYTDSSGNVRYYGEQVDNYIQYNHSLYRIIGVEEGKIKLIMDGNHGLGIFQSFAIYPTLTDYLSSFTTRLLEIEEVDSKSWMTEIQDYWLFDSQTGKVYCASDTDGVVSMGRMVSLYQRYVLYLEGDYYISDGNGTKDSPYEVTYGSE